MLFESTQFFSQIFGWGGLWQGASCPADLQVSSLGPNSGLGFAASGGRPGPEDPGNPGVWGLGFLRPRCSTLVRPEEFELHLPYRNTA